MALDLGLWTRPYVRLSLEQSTVAHASEVLGLQRKLQIEEHANRLRLEQDTNQRELLQRRIFFYRDIISTGDVEQFAMQIAHNESDLSATIKAFHSARDTDHRNLIGFFAHLAESGLIERHEMSDRIREALDWLNKSMTRVIGGNDDCLTNTDRRPSGSTNVPLGLLREAPSSTQTAPMTMWPTGLTLRADQIMERGEFDAGLAGSRRGRSCYPSRRSLVQHCGSSLGGGDPFYTVNHSHYIDCHGSVHNGATDVPVGTIS